MKCNGIDLYTEYGVIVNKYSPDDCLPKSKTESIIYPNIDGSIYKENDTFEPYNLEIECTIIERLDHTKLSDLKKIFQNKMLELEVEPRPNCILKARLITKVDFKLIINGIYKFTLLLQVQPFAELLSGRTWTSINSGQAVFNLGNYPSNPLIKVTGNGVITITINSQIMSFSNVSEPFIIDAELEDVYGLTNNNLNNYMAIESDFVKFPEGQFTMSYTGATRVEIMPRWRML